MCSGSVYLRHRPLLLYVSRGLKINGHGDHMVLVVDMVSEVIFLSYKNTFPNIYVFGISISPSQTIVALCIERSENKWLC